MAVTTLIKYFQDTAATVICWDASSHAFSLKAPIYCLPDRHIEFFLPYYSAAGRRRIPLTVSVQPVYWLRLIEQ